MKNIALQILENVADHPDEIALSSKTDGRWEKISYRDLAARIDGLAAALVRMGIRAGDRVGIFSPNQPRWMIADYAIMSIRAVTVPIYATSTAVQAAEIVRDSGMRMLFTGFEAEYDSAVSILGDCPALERLVAMDDGQILAADHSVHMGDLLRDGGAPEDRAEVSALRSRAAIDDLATIIYTSGTTGTPKGVMLDHANFLNQFTTLDARFDIGRGDGSLCFLPLSHVYERSWSAYLMLRGAGSTVLRNPAQVVTALAEVRPNVMVSAPRLYEKVQAAILTRVESAPPLRRRIFNWALGVGGDYWNRRARGRGTGPWLNLRYLLADRLVLRKVRDAVGGPKKFLSSGGAPLAADVEEFFLKIGLLICQGYGLTESAPMLTCNSPRDFRFGSVGRPIDGVEIRFDEETGEILVRGPNLTRGYYNNAEATAEAFVGDWFRTGDIGRLDEEGFLVITDRLKDLIVTSGGKNVAPQRIESLVGRDHYIDQLAVVGDRRQFVGALIVPAFEALKDFARKRKLPFDSHEDLIKLPEVVELYTKRIREQSIHLAPFERIKRFTLVAKQFSMQAGEITPTLKIRRKVVARKYRALIDRMYGREPAALN